MNVWVKAKLIGTSFRYEEQEGNDVVEVDVEIENFGKRTSVTVNAADVSGQAFVHWSDCAVYNLPAYAQGQCDCGVMPHSI